MPAAPTTKRHDRFYYSIFVFKVGETLFRVPAYGLPGTSAEFKSMFTSAGLVEGDLTSESSDENPLVASEDVTEDEFTNFLQIVYPLPTYLSFGLGGIHVDMPTPNIGDSPWPDVLKVSKLWGIESLQGRAESELSWYVNKMPDVKKILFARKYGVTRWRHEAYLKIGARTEGISRNEKGQLDMDTYVGLLELREVMMSESSKPRLGQAPWKVWVDSAKNTFDFKAAIQDIFNEELVVAPPFGQYL